MREEVTPSPQAGHPVRVLHLLPQLRLGGMEQGVVKLVNGLPPARIASSICSLDAAVDDIRDTLDSRVPVYVVGRRPGNDLGMVWRLIRLLRREKPDVVHSHSWGTLCEGFVAARLAHVGHFVHGEHGTMELRPRDLRVQRWVWSRADRVLSVSSNLADKMAREVGFARDRVQVILNGADLTKFDAAARATARQGLHISETTFVAGTVGRLAPVKDHETLFAALAHLKSAGTRCLALVIGDGPLRGDLEARGRALGLESMLRFLGNRRDVPSILPALDVFLLTSVSEGLPNSILEAMASRLPVVSTRVGGADELVDDGRTGILVRSKDAAALAAAVARLAEDPTLRQRMGAAGQRRAHSKFGLQRMLDEYERLYLEVAGRALPSRVDSKGSRMPCAELPVG